MAAPLRPPPRLEGRFLDRGCEADIHKAQELL
jgi:hypothetical protein